MALFDSHSPTVSRRRFLKAGLCSAAVLAFYSGVIERHWIEITQRDIFLSRLPGVFNGFRIVQLSDIHMDEYTEPTFLRQVIDKVNRIEPDAVFLTGDYVTSGLGSRGFAHRAAWQCASILSELKCKQRFAVLGNHDVLVGGRQVTAALAANSITLLRNAYLPIERNGGRIWLAGLDDPVNGSPKPELAIPPSIRDVANEPIVLLCHAPDYADQLLEHAPGQAVDLMLSGHTHGGQIRLPLLGALDLPDLGKKYVEGWFRLGGLQLYVNRGVGAVGLPFRLDCPPEITLITLRKSEA
jgi:predicted MPP superfamily phosphohydrolase